MRDYGRILGKITNSVWLMEPSALAFLVDMVDQRMKNGKLSDEEVAFRLQDVGVRTNGEGDPVASNGVGVISLYGPIFGKANLMTQMSGATSLEAFRVDLEEMVANDRVHSIVLSIDSPGGTSDGVAESARLIREGKEIKPIYAIADTMAGSAAYWLGSQATKFYATPSGSVGSIGAYTVHEDQSVADAQQGHKFTYISAGPYKTEGNPHEPLSAEGAEYRQEVINELYDDFVSEVAVGRGVEKETVVAHYGGGRMVPAKKATTSGMIDGITTQDGLIGQLSVTGFDRTGTAYTFAADINSGASFLPDSVTLSRTAADWPGPRLEHKDMEHSEPGSGIPPLPRTDDEPDKDKAIKGGWRRDTPPPSGFEEQPDNLPKASAGGEKVNEELFAQLFELYDVDNEADLLAAITSDHEQVVVLSNAVSAATEEQRLSEEYPQMWARMQKLEGAERENKANAFVSAVENIMRPEGESFVPAGYVLSALSQDIIRQAHMKFAEGTGNLADFTEAIQAIVLGGLVATGEEGSTRESELVAGFDTSSDTGIKAVQNEFAAKVAEIQTTEEVSYLDAMKLAVSKYPELAAAYKSAVPR